MGGLTAVVFQPGVQLTLLLINDVLQAGCVQFFVELVKSGVRIQSATEQSLVILGDHVGAGSHFVGNSRRVIGETERNRLLGVVVERSLLIPDVGSAAFPDVADELVGLEPGAGFPVVGGGSV